MLHSRAVPGRLLLAAPLALAGLWACAALWIDGPAARPLAAALVAAYAGASAFALARIRPFGRALAVAAVLFLAVLAWWLSIEPRNDRRWDPSVARLARAEIRGDLVTIHNVRNFDYRSETDFDERWETRTYDLSQLVGADLSVTYWGSPWIAHTIMSWLFADAPPLAISIETRREVGEGYSALLGFFRQFELYYVVADERDLIRLRTSYRPGEDVYLFHLRTPVARARAVLLDYLRAIDDLAEHPRWYNALTLNCTTAIRDHVRNVAPRTTFDWRILVNGKLPELAYERGTIDTSLPLAELMRRSRINERARAADDAPDFSRRIREGLPGFPPELLPPPAEDGARASAATPGAAARAGSRATRRRRQTR